MNNLYKHELNFSKTMEFINDNLYNTTVLSSELLKKINFNSGLFFTLLPSGSNLDRLHEFKEGVILPQFPIIESEINGIKSRYQKIPTIAEELSALIYQKLNMNKKLSCVFDDVTCSPNDSCLKMFYDKNGLYLYENEVLYVIRENNLNSDFISDCVSSSFSFWHSVGVLTEADCYRKQNNTFSFEDIQNICKNTNTIIISAYDGEGYVFWEMTS